MSLDEFLESIKNKESWDELSDEEKEIATMVLVKTGLFLSENKDEVIPIDELQSALVDATYALGEAYANTYSVIQEAIEKGEV